MVTTDEAEAAVAATKIISGSLHWGTRARAMGRLYLEARVLVPETSELLGLTGVQGARNFSFTLLYRGVPIRKATKHAMHRNPNGEVIREPHKHRWDDVDEDGWAYVPADVRWDNPDDALIDFLAECNIRYTGDYQTRFA